MSEGEVPRTAAARARTSAVGTPSPPARKSFQVRKSAGASSDSTTTWSSSGSPGPSATARRSEAT